MQVICGLIILGIVVLLIFFLPAIILGLLAGACAVVSLFLFLHLLCLMRSSSLCSKGGITKVVNMDFDGKQLSWLVDEGLVRANADPGRIHQFGFVIGTACAVALSIVLVKAGNHSPCLVAQSDPKGEETARVIGMVIASGVSLVALIAAIWMLKPKEVFERWMIERVRSSCIPGKKKAERIRDLLSMESSIHSLAGDIGVGFPMRAGQEIQDFVDYNKVEILCDPEKLNEYVSGRINEAQADLSELEKAREVYVKALEVYDQAVHGVTKTGSIPLIKELEQNYAGLTSPDLKSLIPERKWTDFVEVLDAIIGDLNRLSGLAIKYQEQGRQGGAPKDETLTDEERAYRILGVPASASQEQIKRVYQSLAQLWHPDKGMVQDDRRMKEINWAYEFLKNLRQF